MADGGEEGREGGGVRGGADEAYHQDGLGRGEPLQGGGGALAQQTRLTASSCGGGGRSIAYLLFLEHIQIAQTVKFRNEIYSFKFIAVSVKSVISCLIFQYDNNY